MDEYKCDPDIIYLLDVFGAGGAVAFINFRDFIDNMKARADDGDPSAEGLVKILRQFAKLVQIGASGVVR